MKINSHCPVLLIPCAVAMLAFGRAADAPAALPPPWQHQDIGSAQVGRKVPAVPVEKFGKNALFGKSGLIAGTVQHADGVFTLQGTMDIWGPMDGGHFVWQPVQGDFVFVARVASMDNPGKVAHAKAGLCIRESLEGGSRRVAQCITPVDGTQFLYRETPDDKTVQIKPDATAPQPSVPKEKFPCWLKLVRSGNAFSGYESLDGETWWLTGSLKLDFKADAFIGLSSSSHTTNTLTTAVFDQVQLSTPKAGAGTKSAKNRRAQLMTIGIDGADKRLIYETTTSLEAPNWSPDGKWFVYISFPPGTVKHPADKDVILRRMRPDGSEQADIIAFNGGQGTLNVNSWSPDSQRFAFVMYPKVGETPAP